MTIANIDSGLNLDHLEALARATKSGRPSADVNLMLALDAETTLELIALARRAAPVSAPVAGDALPPLPEKIGAIYSGNYWTGLPNANPPGSALADVYTADQMREYACAALANQPAPTAAPEQVARPGDDEFIIAAVTAAKVKSVHPDAQNTIEIGRAVLAAYRVSQPFEAAPLGQAIAANRDAARYRYLATLMDWSDIERMCWSSPADSAEQFKRDLDKYIDGKLADISPDHAECIARIERAAPAPTVPAAKTYSREDVQKWRDDVAHAAADMVERVAPSFGDGDWSWLPNAIRGLAHQPAQEQAEPVRDCADCGGSNGFHESYCPELGNASQAAQHEAGDERDNPLYPVLTLALGALAMHDMDEAAKIGAQARAALAASPVVRAQSEESAQPPMLSPLDYRAQGREEALAIILAQDPEDPFSDHTNSVFGGEDYSIEWDEGALRELLRIGDSTHDAYDRAEAAYWQALGERDEAKREMLLAEQAPFYKPLHDFLSKHQAWDLMADLKRPTAGAQQAHAGADEVTPLAHGHRDDYYLMANARRLAHAPITRIQRMPNWKLASELFATGSNSAYQICRDAGIDPDACTTERSAIRAAQEGGA